MTKVHHQVSQSNWLDGRELGKELSKIPNKKSANAHLQKCHQVSQSNWLDDKGLTKGYLQYVMSIGQSANQMTKASHQD